MLQLMAAVAAVVVVIVVAQEGFWISRYQKCEGLVIWTKTAKLYISFAALYQLLSVWSFR